MSNPEPKQTKAKSLLVITNSRLYDNYYYSIITYELPIILWAKAVKVDFGQWLKYRKGKRR